VVGGDREVSPCAGDDRSVPDRRPEESLFGLSPPGEEQFQRQLARRVDVDKPEAVPVGGSAGPSVRRFRPDDLRVGSDSAECGGDFHLKLRPARYGFRQAKGDAAAGEIARLAGKRYVSCCLDPASGGEGAVEAPDTTLFLLGEQQTNTLSLLRCDIGEEQPVKAGSVLRFGAGPGYVRGQTHLRSERVEANLKVSRSG